MSMNTYAADYETEPNDDITQADPVFLNVSLFGNSGSYLEEDWFFLDTSSTDVLTINMDVEGYSSSNKVYIYDASDNVLYSGYTDAENPITIGLGGAGRYYIKVSAGHDYEMKVSLDSRSPHSDNVTSCTGHAVYYTSTGRLEIPAVDVTDPFGSIATFEVNMTLSPLHDKTMFEVSDVSAK